MDSGLVFGEERHRRCGLGWGKWRGVRAAWGGGGGVGELPGGEVKPSGGSVVVEEGRGAPATTS